MKDFLIEYGVLAVFLCALVETDVSFILTGVVIRLGIVHPLPAFAAMIAGAFLHDSAWFTLGYRRAVWIRNTSAYRKVGPFIERLTVRFGAWQLFLCRFIYGTRNPSLVFWGVQRLAIAKFAAIELLALSVWGTVAAAIGYFLSDRAEAIIGKVKHLEKWVLGALVISLVVVVIVRYFARYEIAKHVPPRDEGS